MNSTQTRYAGRLLKLIEEGKEIKNLPEIGSKPGNGMLFIRYIADRERLHAWLIKVTNIIETAFGNAGPHFRNLQELTKNNFYNGSDIEAITGLLIGSLNDLENGFLFGQEFLIAGEIFDSLLDEAKQIHSYGYKDTAAVLWRVVLEDALKRLARNEHLDDTKKASVLNDELKKTGRYNQHQWRQIQVWLDIGNDAAHGKFEKYSEEQVKEQLNGIESFIATGFKV